MWNSSRAGGGAMLVAALCAALALPGPMVAQGVRVIPQAGLYVPLSDLGRVHGGSEAVEIARMESTLGFGLAVEFMARQPLAFRVNGVYGTESAVPIRSIDCVDCQARSTVAALTGSVVFRPMPNLILVQPYLQAGAGIKRYDFDQEAARQEGLDAFVSDQNRWAAQLGAGVEVGLGGFRFLLDVSNYISGFEIDGSQISAEGKTQHDFFITIGIGLGG